MLGIALNINLDKIDKLYRGGENITGQVKVTVAEKILAAELVLVPYCRGLSKAKNINKTIEKEKEEIKLYKGSWMPVEYIYPFEIVAPPDPQGHHCATLTMPEVKRRVAPRVSGVMRM